MTNINDTVAMLVRDCNALPSTATALAQRSEWFVQPGRTIVDEEGNELFCIKHIVDGLSPHHLDVLAKLIVQLLNENYRHPNGE